MRGERDNLTGRIFGWLLVLARAARGKSYDTRWKCICQCGKERIIYGHRLKSQLTKSCGCWGRWRSHVTKFKHGMGRRSQKQVREYNSWVGAKGRCFNPNNRKFHDYGFRGITMCSRWDSDFLHFLKDMGNCPTDHSLDRINVNGHYSCGKCHECYQNGWTSNCRWTTATQQANNRRPRKKNLTGSPKELVSA